MINVADPKDHTLVDPRLTELSRIASGLGREIVDVAGFLDNVETMAAHQLEALGGVREAAGEVTRGNDAVRSALAEVRASSTDAMQAVQGSSETIRSAGFEARAVATWVRSPVERMQSIVDMLDAVEQNNRDIAAIASQVNILAINAKIEAGQSRRRRTRLRSGRGGDQRIVSQDRSCGRGHPGQRIAADQLDWRAF
jgi:methyl-accepting chemotaxis protein